MEPTLFPMVSLKALYPSYINFHEAKLLGRGVIWFGGVSDAWILSNSKLIVRMNSLQVSNSDDQSL